MDKAVHRFLSASSRIRTGLNVQRQRIQDDYDNAPRVFKGEPVEWVNVSAMHENDVDYYVYEMGRLRAMVKAMDRPFGFPTELKAALKTFDAVVPRLKDIRDPRTHPADNDALDRVTTFSAAMEFHDETAASTTWSIRGISTTTRRSHCWMSSMNTCAGNSRWPSQ